jgi:DeoR family transcriptional regulator, fructose operon transcriptional repressor
MLQLERQLKIVSTLGQSKAVSIVDLSAAFGVSQNTIRRDLQTLAEKGLVSLTHGGAVVNDHAPMGLPLSQREVSGMQEKQAIGLRALELVAEGEAVMLDAGTTTEQIAIAIKDRRSLTVITNALNIAARLQGVPGFTVVLTGGVLNDVTGCVAGFHAEEFLAQFHADKAFISAGGITADSVTNTNAFEVQIKRRMMASAEESYLVVGHAKIGRTSLVPFARPADFKAVLTDAGADPEAVERLRAAGVEVIVC